MGRKSLSALIAGIAVLGVIFGTVSYWWTHHTPDITLEVHPNLRRGEVSDRDYLTLLSLFHECFDEPVRKNMLEFVLQREPQERRVAQRAVDNMMQESRLSSRESFRETRNIAIVKAWGDVIGLYNCRDESDITDHTVMIFNVCLRQDMRRRGLGRKIMKHAIERCRKPDRPLTLTVYRDDTYVVNFYKKLNFKIVEPQQALDSFDLFNKYLMVYDPTLPLDP